MTQRTQRIRRALGILSAVLLPAVAVAGCSAADGPGKSAPARLGRSSAPAPSSAAGPTAAPAASAGSAGSGKGFTLVASGDVLPHTSVISQGAADAGGDGYDFRPMFSGVKPVVSAADLALCHMETVYG
ncbi:CapA family protein, partial [Streptomyces goshikiensis]